MQNWIDRYVYDVARRLPEGEQAEVKRELEANIRDMLSDSPDEHEVKQVLQGLGNPAVLAEKFRAKPRYLISPAAYSSYVQALKHVLPIIGVVMMIVGFALGILDYMEAGSAGGAERLAELMSRGVSMGISAAFQCLVWITIGFAAADRSGAFTGEKKGKPWNPEELPKETAQARYRIGLGETITELCLTVVFAAALVLLCLGKLPVLILTLNNERQVFTVFTESFLRSCVPAIIALASLGVIECLIKLWKRKWTPLVCGAVIVSNLASIGEVLYYLTRQDIFNAEFLAFIQGAEWGSFDFFRVMGQGVIHPVLGFIGLLVVACSLFACGVALYKTIRTRQGSRN